MASEARRRADLELPERDRMPRWVPRAIVLLMAAAVGLATAAWLLDKLQDLLVVLLVSMFLSFAMEPAVNWLAGKGIRRGLGTAGVFLAFAVAAALFGAAIASVLAEQITKLIDAAPGYLADIEQWANDQFGIELSTDNLAAQFSEGGTAASLLGDVAGNLVSVGSTAVNVALQLFTVALFTFYLVAEGPRLRRLVCSALRPERQAVVLRGWELAIDKTGGYIYSRTLLAAAAFVVHWIAFAIIGVPSPLPLALWVGVLSQFVPVVGTYLAGLLPVLIALLDDPISAIWVVIVVLAYQQLENYLLSPRVTAHTMNIHPAVAFGSVLAGAALLGSVGALLAVPAAATIQAFVSTYVARHELIESEMFDTHADESDQAASAEEAADAEDDGTPEEAGAAD